MCHNPRALVVIGAAFVKKVVVPRLGGVAEGSPPPPSDRGLIHQGLAALAERPCDAWGGGWGGGNLLP